MTPPSIAGVGESNCPHCGFPIDHKVHGGFGPCGIDLNKVAEKAKRAAEEVIEEAKVTDEQMRQRMTI